MTDANSKIGFQQFPLGMKFVVFWLGVVGVSRMLWFVERMVIRSEVDLFQMIYGIINFSLVIGLIKGNNKSRIWAIILVGLSFILRTADLSQRIFIYPPTSSTFDLFFVRILLPYFSVIILLIIALLINASILFVILRPSTKALFTPPPALVPAPHEPA